MRAAILALPALLLALELRHESVHEWSGEDLLRPFAASVDPGQRSFGPEVGWSLPWHLSVRGGARWRFQTDDVALHAALRFDLIRE